MEKKRFLAGSMSIALAVTMFSTTAFAEIGRAHV